MEVRTLELSLKGFGAPPTAATVVLVVLTPAERLKRAAALFAVFLVVALVAIPIPIIHLFLVPGALLLGVMLSARRLGQAQVFRRVEGRCPFCGAQQTFSIMGPFKLPRQVHCGHCQRALVIEAGGD
jgi:chromate transport protein ChrA